MTTHVPSVPARSGSHVSTIHLPLLTLSGINRAFALIALLLLQFTAPSAFAATYYWDGNGTVTNYGTPVGGIWAAPTVPVGGTNGWSTSTVGTAAIGTVTTTTNDTLNFGTDTRGLGGSTITVSGTVDAAFLRFGSQTTGNITLSGGTINFSNIATIHVGAGGSTLHTVSSSITGAGTSLTKTGNALRLSGNNSYTGSTIISSGTLALNNAGALGTTPGVDGTSGISLAAGTTLRTDLAAGSTTTIAAPFTLSGTGNTTLSIGSGAASTTTTFTLNGAIGGTTSNLVFSTGTSSFGNGTSRFILGAASTYSGNTLITTGNGANNPVFVNNGIANALPATTVLTFDQVVGGGTGRTFQYDLAGFDQILAGLNNGGTNGSLRRHLVTSSSGAPTLTISNTANYTFGGSDLTTGSTTRGQIQGTIALTKNGSGTFTLGGTLTGGASAGGNTHTGPTKILGGILVLGETLSLQSSPLDTANSITGTATDGLRTTVTNLTLGGLTGNKNFADVFTTTSGGYSSLANVSLNPGSSVTHSYSGALAVNGSMTVSKTGAGTQIISGALNAPSIVTAGKLEIPSTQTGTGAVTLNGGTLVVTISGTSQWQPASLTLAAPSTLEFNNVQNAGTTNAPLRPTAAVGALSDVTVNVNSLSAPPTVGDKYPLLGNIDTDISGYTLVTQPAGWAGHLEVVGATLVYVVDGAVNAWTGADGTQPTWWDIGVTPNWTSPTTYNNTVGALFDDTAVSTTVDIRVPVAPNGVFFANSSLNYTVTASGANVIGGTAGLTKGGSGTAVLAGGAHTYSGATVITAGTLQLGDGTTGNDATLAGTSGVLNRGTLAFNRFGSSTAAYDITGSGKVTKDGAGTQTLTGNHVLNGVTVTGGTLDFSAGTTTNGSATIVVNDSLALGSTLKFSGGSFTAGGTSGTRNLNVFTNGAVEVSSTANVTFPGIVSFGTSTNSSGYLTNSGGTLTVNGFDSGNQNRALIIGEFSGGGNSVFTMSGGTVNVTNGRTYISWGGPATWNMSGGTANLQTLQLGSGVATSPVLNLTGGQLNIGSGGIGTNAASGATINLNGGTVSSLTNWSTTANATIGGNVTFAPAGGHTITWSGILSGTTGDLIVSGPGTLTLSGANTYTGNTRIDGGKLVRPVGFSDASATLILNGTTATNSVSVTDNTKGWTNVAFTAAQAGVLEFNFSVAPSATVSPLEISGLATFTATPAVRVTLSGGSAAGTYPLMTWGSKTGAEPTTANLTVIGASACTLSTVGNTLYLVIPSNVKANNQDNLNLGSSWTTGFAPVSPEAAIWDNTVAGPNTTVLGADTAWGGLKILNPGGLVTINPGNTLTNATGIDMTAATQDLTILADYMPLTTTHSLKVAAGRTLTLSNVLANINTTGNISGPGTVRVVGTTGALRQLTNSVTLLIDGGTVANNGSPLTSGAAAGDTVTTIITNGGSLNLNTVSGSSINFGFQNTGTNVVTLASGSINVASSTNTSANALTLANVAGATAIMNLNGGTVTLAPKQLDSSLTGETTLRMGNNATATSILNLNGGTLNVPYILGTGTSTVNFNGTTVVGNKTNTTWITGLTTANVQAGGAILDSATHDVVVPQALLHDAALGVTPDGGLTKQGSGTLALAGNNTFTGPTTISGGTLQIGNGGTSGSIASTAGVINNGALVYNRSDALTAAYPIAGSGTLTKANTNTLTLSASNSYSGATTINAGTLAITHTNALGTTAGATTVNGGNGTSANTLSLSSATSDLTIAENINLFGNAAGRAQLVNNSAQNHTLTGSINASSDVNLAQFLSTGAGSITVSGDITGTFSNGAVLFVRGTSTSANNRLLGNINLTGGSLAKTDAGTWLVGAPGKTISAPGLLVAVGTLKMGLANVLTGAPVLTLGNSTGGSTGTLDLNGCDQTIGGTIYNGAGSSSGTRTITSATAAILTVTNATDYTTNGSGANSVVITGALGLTKTGAGKLTLPGTNTYTGNTTVNGGTLAIAVDSLATNSTVSVAAGAVLQLDFATTNVIGALVLNGVTQAAGVYSSNNAPAYITGPGSLQATTGGPSGPTLTSVTPNPVPGSSYPVTIGLTGSGFTGATAVLLTNLTAASGASYTPTVNSDTSISVSFVPGTAPTSWDATVVNGTPSAQVGFTVAPPSALNINTANLRSAGPGTVVLSGTGGTAGYSYAVLSATNVTLPMVSWTPVVTNTFGVGGTFSYTNTVPPGTPRWFLRLAQ